jgi:hypothetical protein
MMLAAWNEGVVSCPNGIANPESLAEPLGLKADEQVRNVLSSAIRRARYPEARPPEECPPRRCARPPRCSSRSGSRSRKSRSRSRKGYADNLIKVWIAQTGDEATRTSGLCGRKLDVDQLEPLSREMYELSSQINAPTTWARSTGCAATRGG